MAEQSKQGADREEREMREPTHERGILELTGIDVLPTGGVLGHVPPPSLVFKYRYTSGPFSLPGNAGALDWILLNNDTTQQKARVTVFKIGIGTGPKTPAPPGPLVVTLAPGEVTHNGNTYEEGFIYEIQVECNSRLVFPYVSVWPGNFGVVIPGTEINSGSFIRMMPE